MERQQDRAVTDTSIGAMFRAFMGWKARQVAIRHSIMAIACANDCGFNAPLSVSPENAPRRTAKFRYRYPSQSS